MKNNKEIRLIYRKLDDNFFVINKPVNWTLKKKKVIKDLNFSKCFKEYEEKENKNENTRYINVLKNLSVSEKNTFLFTNSSSYFYNNFNYNLAERNLKDKDKEDGKRSSNNKFIEKYYLESILRCETKTDIYFPYKLPIYMSGLVICCRDYFIYKKFLQMIDENKLIRKYRCLINDPFVFISNKQNSYKKEESVIENIKFLEKQYNQDKSVNKTNDEHIYKKIYLSNISSLIAQKEVSEMFPFYNFFDNNPYTLNYWYYITNLEIEKLTEKMSFLLKNDKKKSTPSKRKRMKYNCDSEKENNDYFIDAYLKKSQPIKSLNNFFTYIFNSDSNNFTCLKREHSVIKESKEQDNPNIENPYYNSTHKKSENELKLSYNMCNLNLNDLYNSKKKILFPLSLFFNESNFFFLDKEIDKYSLKFSMIYKIKNYKEYLEKNIFLNNEKSVNYNLENLSNIFLIEFILLDNPKPDLIRFFFSEANTPIINDNIFDKNNFKKDVINELILRKENNNLNVNTNIFGDTYSDNLHEFFNEKIENYNKQYNDNLLDKYKSNTNAFTIPDDNSLNNANKEIKLNLNNYFINETKNPIDNDYEEHNTKKKFPKDSNLCLELYQLQFRDPLSNDFIKIENSLSTSWM
ncbi:conserved Plasmodium protein, unknown function [Plasmodium gallinaceum]|uniref:Uncharacterized protein n=1 Tax=Plasmodium gallinaceum TaxID=5849 RepID=A0A1J1GVX9_PLAGA|nr:conserved Plasmodium protein, unknown function [Plasmodium gallinaceum]CRG96704.1 conserved Plasmodium protein, unknown function [Plasmodium gallinaceum]